MIKLLYGFDKEVAEFVSHTIDGPDRGFLNSKAIGVVRDDNLVAGVVYHNWSPEAGVIEMSAAATDPKWLLGPTLHEIFAYPFEQIGCQMIVLRVSENNKRMCRIAERFGFHGHLIPRLRGRNENEFIFTLTVEDWRNTGQERKRNGQAIRSSAA